MDDNYIAHHFNGGRDKRDSEMFNVATTIKGILLSAIMAATFRRLLRRAIALLAMTPYSNLDKKKGDQTVALFSCSKVMAYVIASILIVFLIH